MYYIFYERKVDGSIGAKTDSFGRPCTSFEVYIYRFPRLSFVAKKKDQNMSKVIFFLKESLFLLLSPNV